MAKTKGALGLTVPEKERIKSLAAIGLTTHAIGEQLGREPRTVQKAMKEPGFLEAVAERAEKLAELCESNAERLLSYSDSEIAKLNVYQRSISGGIMIDKARLLRGSSTVNIGLGIDISERLQWALKKARQCRGEHDENT